MAAIRSAASSVSVASDAVSELIWLPTSPLVSSLRVDCYGGYGDAGYDEGRYDEPHRGRGHRHGAVTVFSDSHFEGRRESFRYDDADLRDNPIRQDTISSIHVAPGCRAVLFSNIGFRGRALAVTGSVDNLRYSAIGNDRVSSIQVDCRGYR